MQELQITSETNNPVGRLLVESFNVLIKALNSGVLQSMFTKTITLAVSGSDTTELGSSFTPPIIKQPSLYNAIKLENDGSGTDYSYVISGFVPNADGIHWDITFAPNDEEITGLIINVQ